MSGTAAAPATRVYVVILNWNGWRDTIACLETVLRSTDVDYQVVVCDNASDDGSLDRLLAWACGVEAAPPPDAGDPLARLAAPAGRRAVPHAVLTRGEAEAGGGAPCAGARVVFVQTGANLGYAGGCNVGLRYALARGDAAYAWLLNNDAVVEPGALAALVRRLAARPAAGQCGSRVLHYDDPSRVQCRAGATYQRWLATTHPVGAGEPADAPADEAAVERRLAYVTGASALVRREFLERVGLMDERYFLYFEELDWATRGRDFERAYAHASVVYHREGRSVGSSADSRRRSDVSDYYGLRNRLVFTRRFFPWAVPTVYCGLLVALVKRLLRRQFHRAAMVVDVMCGRARPPAPTARAARPAPAPPIDFARP